jgi:hypothetical protein
VAQSDWNGHFRCGHISVEDIHLLLWRIAAGWLTKKGHRVNNWKRRWFELFVDYSAGEYVQDGNALCVLRYFCVRRP